MDEARGGTAGDEGGTDDDVDFTALLREGPTGGFVPCGGHFLKGGEGGRRGREGERVERVSTRLMYTKFYF